LDVPEIARVSVETFSPLVGEIIFTPCTMYDGIGVDMVDDVIFERKVGDKVVVVDVCAYVQLIRRANKSVPKENSSVIN
jgi:hypothetical protein